jgi:DNA-binding GntR family transcriptional regulator
MIGDRSGTITISEQDGEGAVGRAATAVRNLILRREIVPGQQLRQEDLARQIGISRGPLREALQVLAGEGVLNYVRNRGYFVTRLAAREMQQVYLIRDLLETEILRSLPPAPEVHLAGLRSVNARIRDEKNDLLTVIYLNKQFHDLISSPSPLKLLIGEIEQVSRMAIAYQALSLSSLDAWQSVTDDHEMMIDALARYDLDSLVATARAHRHKTLTVLLPVLL